MHEGTPLDVIQGYRCLGVYTIDDFNVKTDDNGKTTYTLKEGKYGLGGTVMPGDLKYEDVNGDGTINNQDQVELGKSGTYGAPWTIGLNLTLKYKNWTLL